MRKVGAFFLVAVSRMLYAEDGCSEYLPVAVGSIDKNIVDSVLERSKVPIEYFDVNREICPEKIYYAFMAKGEYSNPGSHWLVEIDRNNGHMRIIDGM